MNIFRQLVDRISEPRLTRLVQPYTLVSASRIRTLCRLARRIEKDRVPGDVVECGVCNGGTAAILSRLATHSQMQRTVWLLDSFEGMPSTTKDDVPAVDGGHAETYIGKEVGHIARVREILSEVGSDMDRIRLIPGWFQDTLPGLPVKEIALLNIDADWYESVKLCIETLYDRVVPGGFVSIDDYGHWPGCQKAVDEFLSARGLTYALNCGDYTMRWFRKE